jgi:hypothetical protein
MIGIKLELEIQIGLIGSGIIRGIPGIGIRLI